MRATSKGESSGRRRSGMVPRARYDALVARIEDLEDQLEMIKLDRQAASRDGKPSANALPDELVSRLLGGDHPVDVWRAHRGYTLARLEALSGVPSSYISEIVNRKKPGSADALSRLAGALDISLEDLTAWDNSVALSETVTLKPVRQAPVYNPNTKRVWFLGSVKKDVPMIVVSREALEDLANKNDLDESSAVKTVEKNLGYLYKIAARKYAARVFHAEGYILIDPGDLD